MNSDSGDLHTKAEFQWLMNCSLETLMKIRSVSYLRLYDAFKPFDEGAYDGGVDHDIRTRPLTVLGGEKPNSVRRRGAVDGSGRRGRDDDGSSRENRPEYGGDGGGGGEDRGRGRIGADGGGGDGGGGGGRGNVNHYYYDISTRAAFVLIVVITALIIIAILLIDPPGEIMLYLTDRGFIFQRRN